MNIPTLLEELGAQKPLNRAELEALGMEPCPTCEDGLVPMSNGAVKVCPVCGGRKAVEKKNGGGRKG